MSESNPPRGGSGVTNERARHAHTVILPNGQPVNVADKESADNLSRYIRESAKPADQVPAGKTRVTK